MPSPRNPVLPNVAANRPNESVAERRRTYPQDSHYPQARVERFRLVRLGTSSHAGLSRPPSGPPETEWCSRPRPPRKRRTSARMNARKRMERVEKEEARGASRTHFPGPSGGTGAFGRRNREGNPERQQCRKRNPDRKLIEVARFRWSSGQGTERNRKESNGTQGTDRGRKAPAGTPPRESASALTGSGRDLRKVGAGGNTSPHFHFRHLRFAAPVGKPAAKRSVLTLEKG